MTRDDDLLRQMLFDFEASKDYLILDRKSLGMSEDERKWQHHLDLLCDQGFVRQISSSGYRLTSAGHDFINAIRSDTAWEKTKDGFNSPKFYTDQIHVLIKSLKKKNM